jgi:hypothetical protein
MTKHSLPPPGIPPGGQAELPGAGAIANLNAGQAELPEAGVIVNPNTGKKLSTSDFDTKAIRDSMKSNTNAFTQLVEPLKLIRLDGIIAKHGSDKWSKKFLTIDQLMSMLFAQFSGAASLRELEHGLEIMGGSLVHAGLTHMPRRTTIAYANEHRSYEVFEDIFYALLPVVREQCERNTNGSAPYQFKLNGKVYHFDASVVDLCHSMFDWAHFRTAKGGIKLHLMLEHNVFLPVFANITEAKIHDQKAMEILDPVAGLTKGSYVCVDRGYVDFEMFYSWTKRGINFVTRLKRNMVYNVVEELKVPNQVGRPADGGCPAHQGKAVKGKGKAKKPRDENLKTTVLKDEIVEMASPKGRKDYPEKLRIVTADVVSGKGKNLRRQEMKLLTNNMKLSPVTICQLYRGRWEVEAFFRLIKQELSVKSFLGTSANAVKTQVYIALIAFLLLRYLQASLETNWSMGHLVPAVRQLLPLFRKLKLWLDHHSKASLRNLTEEARIRGRPKKVAKPSPFAIDLLAGL